MEWALQHQSELMENWNLMKQSLPLKKIEPLKQINVLATFSISLINSPASKVF
jgi:hypothetical protein